MRVGDGSLVEMAATRPANMRIKGRGEWRKYIFLLVHGRPHGGVISYR